MLLPETTILCEMFCNEPKIGSLVLDQNFFGWVLFKLITNNSSLQKEL